MFPWEHPRRAQALLYRGNTTAWWAILGLSVLTDFLFVPIAISLYMALKGFNRNAMLLATACIALFVFLDLALTWPNYGALITFSGMYSKCASRKRAFLAVASQTGTRADAVPVSTTLRRYRG